jgi:hypothetical protein
MESEGVCSIWGVAIAEVVGVSVVVGGTQAWCRGTMTSLYLGLWLWVTILVWWTVDNLANQAVT